jgi:diguanylate cyclase (GGDEF)-like protein
MATRKRRTGVRRTAARSIFHDLPADWYWEQDAELRFTRIEARTGGPAEQALVRRQLGKRRWETGIEIEGDWEAHRAVLDAHQPFSDVLMWRSFEDGSRRYLSVSGEPVFDARGRFTGYRGIGRDVTAQKRVERLLRLEHRVTRCLAEGQDAAQALRAVLKAVCDTEGWDCGQLWKPDAATGELRQYAAWAPPELESARDFVAASRDLAVRPGIGLIGTVWQSAEPLWVADSLEDPRALRRELVLATGLRAAVLLPVRAGGRVNAVLDFTCRRIRPPHKRLQQALHVVATLIGQYLERADAEHAVRESEARFRSLTNLSSDWYWEQDAEYRFTRLEGQLEHEVARSLAAADDPSSGLRSVIRAVCLAEGWACGRYFRVDHGILRFQDAWAGDDPLLRQFILRARDMTFAPGEGITGTVLKVAAPVWTHDAPTDGRAKYGAMWEGTGLRGGISFPVMSENRIIGVLSFSSQSVREPDQRLIEASRVIGSQIGQFLRRKQAEDSLRESEARFRRLTEMSSDFYWETDTAHRVSQLVHGPNYPDVVLRGALGKASWELPSVSPDEAGWASQRARMDEHRPFRDFEFGRNLPDGTTRYFSVSGEPRFRPDGAFFGYQGVGRDITEIALARERISSLAYSDSLTGLANRTSFGPSLDQAVQRSRRRGSKLAVVFIDLDGFKQINDLHGHDAGDALLIELAARLRANLRASDLVARLGGDEFVVALEEVQEAGPIEIVAKKLLAEVVRPYSIAASAAVVTASIGISMFPDDAADAQSLIKHADTAMYAAKQAGKNTWRFYSSGPAANDPLKRDSSEGAG